MKRSGADTRKAAGHGAKRPASSGQEGIARVTKSKSGQSFLKVDPDAGTMVVKGYFDRDTGLSTVTEMPAYGGHIPDDGRAVQPQETTSRELFDVVVIAGHIFQVAPTALRCLHNYSEEEIHLLVVPKRTLARRMAQGEPLSVEETDKAVRLARVDKLAAEVFGDEAKAHRWLRKPKGSLGGETPLAYLSTEAGARVVEDMLNQIDHGILP